MLFTVGWRYLALALLVGLGAGVYFAAGRATGAFSMAEFRGTMRR